MKAKRIDLAKLLMHMPDGSRACHEAREWAAGKTLKRAWETCPRGDWMLWSAPRLGVNLIPIIRASCGCARLALPYATGNVPRETIETVELWCDGTATIEEVQAAARAAAAEAATGAAGAATGAAWAAARAARAARAATRAAAAAAGAAWAAARAAEAAAAEAATGAAEAAAAEKKMNKQSADIVRIHISYETILALATKAQEGAQ